MKDDCHYCQQAGYLYLTDQARLQELMIHLGLEYAPNDD
jgi:hypothetical protein